MPLELISSRCDVANRFLGSPVMGFRRFGASDTRVENLTASSTAHLPNAFHVMLDLKLPKHRENKTRSSVEPVLGCRRVPFLTHLRLLTASTLRPGPDPSWPQGFQRDFGDEIDLDFRKHACNVKFRVWKMASALEMAMRSM